MAKYDWTKIEHEYVTGKASMEALAKKHKIPINTFYKHAKEAEFSKKREKYTKTIQEKALARAAAREAKTIDDLKSAAGKAAKLLSKAFGDEATLHNELGYVHGRPVEERMDRLNTKALRDLPGAVKDLAAVLQAFGATEREETQAETGNNVLVLAEREDETE